MASIRCLPCGSSLEAFDYPFQHTFIYYLMKIRSQLIPAIAALSVGLATLTGCKSDPASPGNDVNTDPIVAPKQGSTFTYNVYKTDSTNKKVPGSDETVIYTVVSTNLTLGGKSNVLLFTSDRSDSGYIHYESNGDVAIYQGSDEGGVEVFSWITLPFVSRATRNETLIDTTLSEGPFSGKVKVTSQTTGTGTEKIKVGTEELKTNKATWKLDVTIPFFGTSVTSTSTSTFAFHPKVGFWVKQESQSNAVLSGVGGTSGEVMTLTSYSLK